MKSLLASGNGNKTHAADMAAGKVKGTKQLKHEILPSRHSMAQLTGGDLAQRTMGNYAKQSPADANGMGAAGMNILLPGGGGG